MKSLLFQYKWIWVLIYFLFRYMYMHMCMHVCVTSNENRPHKFKYLNSWSPICGTVWERLGSLVLGGGVPLEVGFEVLKSILFSLSSLSVSMPMDQMLSIHILLFCYVCLWYSMIPPMIVMYSFSQTIYKSLIRYFLL